MRMFAVGIFILLTACATPSHIKTGASKIIPPGACYDFFTKSGLGTYQHNAQMMNPKASFALAIDPDNRHVCGAASRTEVCPNIWTTDCEWEKVEALALSRCELQRQNTGGQIKSACKPFARNNEIIWDQYKNEEIKLQ